MTPYPSHPPLHTLIDMKTLPILLSAMLLGGSLAAEAKSAKRGLSENQFQYKAQMEALAPGSSWYYNWGNTPGRYLAGETYMAFAPMCWNASYSADNIRNYVKEHPETELLLGFNEPNFTNQADMTPAAAAAAWPAVRALAAELGLKLVAPALNTSPNPPYQDPTKWMDEFVALVGDDAFDYLAVHAYGGFNAMQSICTTFHDRYGKDVLLTEFCLWPNEGQPNSYVNPDSQTAFMMQALEWLETTPWIYRYAWFKAIGESSSPTAPNYGLLLSGKGENPRELSTQGKVYTYLSDFDPEVYHAVDSPLTAVQYISQTSCLLGDNDDPEVDCPLQFTRFNAGATVDYQWDVAAAGDYFLQLRVSGMGEPTRFDPTIGVVAVKPDGSDGATLSPERTLTLPNSDATYVTVSFPMTLDAGHQRLRIKDFTPGRPSGIHISSVTLTSTSGVDGVTAEASAGPVRVYTPQGILVRDSADPTDPLQGLPKGLYIVGGKKLLK